MTQDSTAIPLRADTIGTLPANVDVPRYDLAQRRVGIVHLGLGGFHRAHMARYTHALMQQDPAALRWSIAGAGLLPSDRRMAESLGPQDGLYTLVERSGSGETVSVIGSIARVIYAGDSSTALLEAIADPEVCIVSLTVTENGYCLNPATRQFDPDHALIRADLAAPKAPRSAIGIIVEAYRRRMQGRQPAFTALSCDNIQHNGNVLRAAVLALARLRDPALAAWIEAQRGVSQHDGGPDHPGHRGRRISNISNAATVSPIAGRWSARISPSGSSRIVSLPGARSGKPSAHSSSPM